MSTFFANSITIQISATVRLIFQDLRQGLPPFEGGMLGTTVGEAILSLDDARALRNLLTEYVKDDPPPGLPQ